MKVIKPDIPKKSGIDIVYKVKKIYEKIRRR